MNKTNKVDAAQAAQFDLAPAAQAAQETTTTALAVNRIDVDGAAMIADLSSATMSYCSMNVTDNAGKIAAYNAMANADEKLTDHVGESIDLRHVYVEAINCVDEKTGESTVCPRIVLIAKDGTTYQAVSKGIFGSLRQIFQMFGAPETWEFALRVKVKQSRTRRGYTVNTLEAVEVIPD